MRMPEEINRLLSDRVSTKLFCPTQTAVENLAEEGISSGVHLVGDVMYDAALFYRDKAAEFSTILQKLGLRKKEYILATCHRAENTDDPARLDAIAKGLAALADDKRVIMPVHPRTRAILTARGLVGELGQVDLLDPVSYLDMVQLECGAQLIVTDSGGMQKEAFFFSVPCITLRDETEWIETVQAGANLIVGADDHLIIEGAERASHFVMNATPEDYFGLGDASEKIVELLG